MDTNINLREALQLTAGALQALAKTLPLGERHTVNFTGDWQDCGAMTVKDILDRADAALEETRTYIADANAEVA